MPLTDKDLDSIENYFSRSLSEPDQLAFERRSETDALFRKAVNEYQATSAVLHTVRQRQQKRFLQEIDASMRPVRVGRFGWLWWAALGLAFVASVIWFVNHNAARPKSPIAGLFDPYPGIYTKGGEQKNKETAAFAAYQAGQYGSAANLFSEAFKEKPDTMFLFYKGVAELGAGDAAKAAADLEKIQNAEVIPTQAVFYFLGLAASENGKPDQAIVELNKAAQMEGEYREKAEAALALIKMKK